MVTLTEAWRKIDDPFTQFVEDCFSHNEAVEKNGANSPDDFISMCFLRLGDLGNQRGVPIIVNYGEDDGDLEHHLSPIFLKVYRKYFNKIQELIGTHAFLIHHGEVNEENDRIFRSINPKLKQTIETCVKVVDRICQREIGKIQSDAIADTDLFLKKFSEKQV